MANQLGNSELSVFRPAWTSESLKTCDDLHYCGIKRGYFWKTRGLPGHLLDANIPDPRKKARS